MKTLYQSRHIPFYSVLIRSEMFLSVNICQSPVRSLFVATFICIYFHIFLYTGLQEDCRQENFMDWEGSSCWPKSSLTHDLVWELEDKISLSSSAFLHCHIYRQPSRQSSNVSIFSLFVILMSATTWFGVHQITQPLTEFFVSLIVTQTHVLNVFFVLWNPEFWL